MYLDAQQILRDLRLRLLKEKFPEHVSKYFAQTKLLDELNEIIIEANRLPASDQIELLRHWFLRQRHQTNPPLPAERIWNVTRSLLPKKPPLARSHSSTNNIKRQTRNNQVLPQRNFNQSDKKRQTQSHPHLDGAHSSSSDLSQPSSQRPIPPKTKTARVTRSFRALPQRKTEDNISSQDKKKQSKKRSATSRSNPNLPQHAQSKKPQSSTKKVPKLNQSKTKSVNSLKEPSISTPITSPSTTLPTQSRQTNTKNSSAFRQMSSDKFPPVTETPSSSNFLSLESSQSLFSSQEDLPQPANKKTSKEKKQSLQDGFFSVSSSQLPQVEQVKLSPTKSEPDSNAQLKELLGDIKELQKQSSTKTSSKNIKNTQSFSQIDTNGSARKKSNFNSNRLIVMFLLLVIVSLIFVITFYASPSKGTPIISPILMKSLPVSAIYKKKQQMTLILKVGWKHSFSLDALLDKLLKLRVFLKREKIRYVHVISSSGELLFKMDLAIL